MPSLHQTYTLQHASIIHLYYKYPYQKHNQNTASINMRSDAYTTRPIWWVQYRRRGGALIILPNTFLSNKNGRIQDPSSGRRVLLNGVELAEILSVLVIPISIITFFQTLFFLFFVSSSLQSDQQGIWKTERNIPHKRAPA